MNQNNMIVEAEEQEEEQESKLCIGGFQFVTIFQTCSDTSDMRWIKMSKKK